MRINVENDPHKSYMYSRQLSNGYCGNFLLHFEGTLLLEIIVERFEPLCAKRYCSLLEIV